MPFSKLFLGQVVADQFILLLRSGQEKMDAYALCPWFCTLLSKMLRDILSD